MSSSFKGGKGFRRILKQFPDEARQDIVGSFDRAGRRTQAAMRARAKRKTGALQQGVKYRVLPKSLRLQVGLLGTKRGRAKLFYGYILDKGRDRKTVTIKRGPRAGASMRIRRLIGDRFVSGEYADFRDGVVREVKPTLSRVLARLARGGAGD